MNKKILIFTATFNEAENIEYFIKSVMLEIPYSNLLIVDDNSPDGTSNKIKELQKTFQNLHLIIRNKKEGLDSAHKLGFKFAKENQYNYFITLDADLSHNPNEIKKFIDELSVNSFVIGSRYMNGSQCLTSAKRLLISKMGNKLIKLMSGLEGTEFTTSFRGFNLDKLNNFDLFDVKNKGYSFFMGTLFEIDKLGEPYIAGECASHL